MIDQATRLREIIHQNKIKKNSQNSTENMEEKTSNNARIICVTSGKGGVGKTNFTTNLAIALSKLNKRIVIIDADLGLANVDVISGVIPKYTLLDVIKYGKDITEIMNTGPNGIRIISGGSGILDLVDMREEDLKILINNFNKIDEYADIILIDTGAGLSKSVLSFVMAATEVIIVTTSEPTSITDAYAMIKSIGLKDKSKKVNIVVNRVENLDDGKLAFDKLKNVTNKFLYMEINKLGFLFEDIHVRKAVKQQKPFVLEYPNTIVSKNINNIALKLTNNFVEDNQKEKSKNFFVRVLEFFK